MHKLRKFTGWYTHGVPHGKELRARINELADVSSFLAAVESFFDELTAPGGPGGELRDGRELRRAETTREVAPAATAA
jgi:hypothetical protein